MSRCMLVTHSNLEMSASPVPMYLAFSWSLCMGAPPGLLMVCGAVGGRIKWNLK